MPTVAPAALGQSASSGLLSGGHWTSIREWHQNAENGPDGDLRLLMPSWVPPD